ncbi:MAG: type II toxin-antitoxin system VapC family toxin [Sphingomonas sp.]
MILADSSIWIDHLRAANPLLVAALDRDDVVCHPFVVGEVAMGSLRDRAQIVRSMQQLPQVERATDGEVLILIERHRLFGTGLGYIDTHLLASALIADETTLWTRDRRLRDAAARLRLVGFPPVH